MSYRKSFPRRGFTLVELMTVVAIIVLLISVLVPALSSARVQAKRTVTAGLIKALDSGCEMFRSDFKRYPQSRGPNPFDDPADDILLMGFQWLGLQLVGPDTRGIVDWTDPSNNTTLDDDKAINNVDWEDWYSLAPSRDYGRKGPYAALDGDSIQSLATYTAVKADCTEPPVELTAGASVNWTNEKMPFFIDSFNNPVLYYRANVRVDAPFTTGDPDSTFVVGRYDQTDNGYITGTPGVDGRYAAVIGSHRGWDLTGTSFGSSDFAHKLGALGYDVANPQTFPNDKTFASFIVNGKVLDNTFNAGLGRVEPYKPDSFILITAGEDGVYGTADDITNFTATN